MTKGGIEVGILQFNDASVGADATELMLIAAARKAVAGNRAELLRQFPHTTVYIERSPNGLLIQHDANQLAWIHAYSSVRRIPGVSAGLEPNITWMTGAHLRAAADQTVGIKLDPGAPWACQIVFPQAPVPPVQSN